MYLLPTDVIYIFDPDVPSWMTILAKGDIPRHSHFSAAVTSGHQIYIFGGSCGGLSGGGGGAERRGEGGHRGSRMFAHHSRLTNRITSLSLQGEFRHLVQSLSSVVNHSIKDGKAAEDDDEKDNNEGENSKQKSKGKEAEKQTDQTIKKTPSFIPAPRYKHKGWTWSKKVYFYSGISATEGLSHRMIGDFAVIPCNKDEFGGGRGGGEGGGEGGNDNNSNNKLFYQNEIVEFDPASETFGFFPTTGLRPNPKTGFALATFGDHVFVHGGIAKGQRFGLLRFTLYQFDNERFRMREKPRFSLLNKAVYTAASVACGWAGAV